MCNDHINDIELLNYSANKKMSLTKLLVQQKS